MTGAARREAPPAKTDGGTGDAHPARVCGTCPRHCRLPEGALGFCRARRNVNGTVRCESYGRVTSLALDPVEKKPLARWEPGTSVVSVGSFGCNLRCPFCQNWEISQASSAGVGWREIMPDELVGIALQARDEARGFARPVSGIAYTYNEPLMSWEYIRDCARLAHAEGLSNVLVSNGCVEPSVMRAVAPLVDAANIDLKSFSPDYYAWCSGDAAGAYGGKFLSAVKDNIVLLANTPGCHLEVTCLVVTGANDSEAEMRRLSGWLASVNPHIVLHVTRFFPRWQVTDRGPTPPATVRRLAQVARERLETVLVGNC